MFSPEVGELAMRWYVVDANLALFDNLADEKESQGPVLCASTLGPVADDEERGSVVNAQR